jgi:hypothetical protein
MNDARRDDRNRDALTVGCRASGGKGSYYNAAALASKNRPVKTLGPHTVGPDHEAKARDWQYQSAHGPSPRLAFGHWLRPCLIIEILKENESGIKAAAGSGL